MLKKFLLPIIDLLDPETEHLAIRELLYLLEQSPKSKELLEKLAYKRKRIFNKKLQINIKGLAFDNPILVAAGFDKVGHAVKALYTLGFAGVEVGTVPSYPQDGNPKPRHFRLSPGVHLNRYGFNTPGMNEVAKNLNTYKNSNIPIGISLGKNKTVSQQDAPRAYAIVAKKMYALGSYFVINVSSPNTPNLRKLQDKKPLTAIVKAVLKTMETLGGYKPLFVKIAPDMTFEAVDDVIDVVLEHNLTGIIATNTTANPNIKAKYGKKWRNEMGGLSGDDKTFRKMATDIIKHIFKQAGKKLVIIGAGGIKDTATALEKIKAGASLIQIMSALDEKGPELPGKINMGLIKYMEKEGIKSISKLIGVDVN